MKETTNNFVSNKQKYIKNVLGIDIFIVSLIAVVSNFPEYMIEPTLALYALSLGSSMTFNIAFAEFEFKYSKLSITIILCSLSKEDLLVKDIISLI